MSFSGDLERRANAKLVEVKQAVRDDILAVFARVIVNTPVLTGRLRAAWVFTDALDSLRNDTPYAYGVEYDGWAAQHAPQGMVRLAIAEFLAGAHALGAA